MIKSIYSLFLLLFVITGQCLAVLPTVGFSQTEDLVDFTLDFAENSIVITIKNNLGASYYNLRFKIHNENEWNYYPIDPTSSSGYNTYNSYNNSVPYEASNSDFTIVTLYLNKFHDLAVSSKVEVQIQALIGNYKEVVYGFSAPLPTYDYYFEGKISDWSSTQTVEYKLENEVSTPSVPEFTVKYLDNSYDVPPTYEINQFTGNQIVKSDGYHVDKRTIEFTIKNQDFTPYQDSDGNNIILYYNFRFKGPYAEEWTEYPNRDYLYGYLWPFPDIKASDSDYTTIDVAVISLTDPITGPQDIPTGIQMQFQMQAIIGYIDTSFVSLLAGSYINYHGKRSDWSDTQTVILSEDIQATESIPEFPSWVVLPLFISISTIVIVSKNRLNKAKKNGVSA